MQPNLLVVCGFWLPEIVVCHVGANSIFLHERTHLLPGFKRFRTWVVPGSHKDPRNPRGPNDGIDERAPIPGEMQVSCPAGSVYVQDTRTWHAGAANQSQYERTAIVCRYAPWWLSSHEFGNLHSGGQHVHSYVPKECAVLH